LSESLKYSSVDPDKSHEAMSPP